jgi:hypothetical protein
MKAGKYWRDSITRFRPSVFFIDQTHRFPITGLKLFHIWLRIGRDIRNEKCLRYVNHNSFLLNFSGVDDTAEMAMIIRCKISAVSWTPLKRFLHCQWHCWNYFSFVTDTAETVEVMSMTIQVLPKKKLERSQLHFWFHRCHWHLWNQIWGILKRLSRRIRSHMRKGFNPLIRYLGGVDWCK